MDIPWLIALLLFFAFVFGVTVYRGKAGAISAMVKNELLNWAMAGFLAIWPLLAQGIFILVGEAAGLFIVLCFLAKRGLLHPQKNIGNWGIALSPIILVLPWMYWGKGLCFFALVGLLVHSIGLAVEAIKVIACYKANSRGKGAVVFDYLAMATIVFCSFWVLPPVWNELTGLPFPLDSKIGALPFFAKISILAVVSLFAAMVGVSANRAWNIGLFPVSVAWLLQVFSGFSENEIQWGLPVFLLLVALAWLAFQKGWLDYGGSVTACLLGFVIWAAGGWAYLGFIGLFFVSSTLLGRVKQPYNLGADEKMGKARDSLQVLCNGGVAGGCMVWYGLEASHTAQLLFGISVAISTADTWSSEIGTRFGGKVVNIIGFKPLPTGVSGGISLAGTMAGLAGAVLMGWAAWLLHFNAAGWVIVGGFVGMVLDSLLGSLLQPAYLVGGKWSDRPPGYGATLPVKGVNWMSNDLVNLVSNLIVVLSLGLIITILWKRG